MAYMGLLRTCEKYGGFGPPALVLVGGKGKPLAFGRELCGVGVRSSLSSSGRVTENMRVMKMVRRLASLSTLSLESLRGRSAGGLAGVKDLAKLLLLRKPSARPSELVASMLVPSTGGVSPDLASSGTMCILLELPR
jgi:hypothetical protein